MTIPVGCGWSVTRRMPRTSTARPIISGTRKRKKTGCDHFTPNQKGAAKALPPHKDNIKELKFRASKAEVCAMIGTYFCFCQFIYSSMIVSDIFSKDIERGMFNPYIACGISRKKILLLVSCVTNPRDRELPTLTLLGKIL